MTISLGILTQHFQVQTHFDPFPAIPGGKAALHQASKVLPSHGPVAVPPARPSHSVQGSDQGWWPPADGDRPGQHWAAGLVDCSRFGGGSWPICSMYGIFTYIWVILPTKLGDFVRANVGKYCSTMEHMGEGTKITWKTWKHHATLGEITKNQIFVTLKIPPKLEIDQPLQLTSDNQTLQLQWKGIIW